jgi:hypothetical protein
LKLRPWHGLAMRVVVRRTARFAMALLLLCASAPAQQPAESPPVSPHARLLAARSVYIEHSGGRIPYDVIGDAFQGWGRYTVVRDPAAADLIVSIRGGLSDSGLSVSGGPPRGVASADVSGIRLLILDAHDRAVLWSAAEQPKSSLKEKKREDNEVEASLRLFRRFRNSIEPEPKP